ncbi:NAD(P)/FAD-dependent oxidoreductase [Bacillus sp. BRMEA1]|uniref:NAD(P)/FAD-dependent oxidoreductase n=1 Tax=Neobacillus endophyticus TaxID=2738405 RepID=UPI0015677387|nr:NAD(P)/FAD-dependent oxidoreductase [Neobacillus endophyticus]NRD77766.1 NAD(P)/FAD-dependent oxidoreductase [Neobacillus endophyticus]
MQYVDVMIVGGGPAGISAAIWCKRLGIDHLLLEKKNELGGQLAKIQNEIIDYPGLYAENGQAMQMVLTKHAAKLNCNCKLNATVLKIDEAQKTVTFEQDGKLEVIHFRYLVLASGAGQRRLEVPGEREMLQRGEDYSATTDGQLFKNKTAAVVGGGDRAFEGAILLADAGVNVFLIHRTQSFKARSEFITLANQKSNIKILTDTKVTAINGDHRVTSITLVKDDGESSCLMVDAVFVRIGIKRNYELVEGKVAIDPQGLIVTDQTGKTSNSSIFAVGDVCTDSPLSSIAASVGQGATAAKFLASLLV